MPWKESVAMDERLQFVRDALRDRFTMRELCARYGVSRRIGYKWLARYEAEGRRGLVERSRAPQHSPHKIASAIAELLVAEREAHPHWGARKLLKVLATRHPRMARLACREHGRRFAGAPWTRPAAAAPAPASSSWVIRPTTAAPNDLWTADFKGQFRTGNGQYCYPLTLADQHTRFLLTCHGLLSTQTVSARPVFERAFREYGLPIAIRTDNGVPFATQAIHGLSYLNVWWMRLGILHQRIPAARRRTARTNGCIAR
jgi:putative transposase